MPTLSDFLWASDRPEWKQALMPTNKSDVFMLERTVPCNVVLLTRDVVVCDEHESLNRYIDRLIGPNKKNY